jgi:hypothetical protein
LAFIRVIRGCAYCKAIILNLSSAIGWDYTLNASPAEVNPSALRLMQFRVK